MLKRYKLGEYVLDAEAQLLRKNGDRVHLNGLPLQVLVYLIEHRDRLVSRTELLDHFWEGRDVYDDSMRKAIGSIRKALADNASQPDFIETRRAGGYRYIGPFEVLTENQNLVQQPLDATSEMEKLSGVRIIIEKETIETDANANAALAHIQSSRSLKTILPLLNNRAVALALLLGLVVLTSAAFVFYARNHGNNETASLPIRSIAVTNSAKSAT